VYPSFRGRKSIMRSLVQIILNVALVPILFATVATYSAAQGPSDANTGHPITIGVGQGVSVCKTGTVICPVRSPICDDLSVATVRGGKDGLEIVGVKPGATLCSVVSVTGLRTLYSVTVR
jgi:hypothetical protein